MIAGAVPIRGRRLLTFLSQMRHEAPLNRGQRLLEKNAVGLISDLHPPTHLSLVGLFQFFDCDCKQRAGVSRHFLTGSR